MKPCAVAVDLTFLNRVAYQTEIRGGFDDLPASPSTKNAGTGTVEQVVHSDCKTSDDLGDARKTCEAATSRLVNTVR